MLFSALFISFLSSVTLTVKTINYNPITGEKTQGRCTAVFVAPHQVVTAAHCVESALPNKMWVRTDEGASHPVQVLRIEAKKDLAMLFVDGPPHKFVKLATRKLRKGDRVYLLSSEDSMVGAYGEGVVANIILDQAASNTPSIIHTAAILPGASGSGLFNDRGELVGINTMRQGAISSAVDLIAVRHMMEDQAREEELAQK